MALGFLARRAMYAIYVLMLDGDDEAFGRGRAVRAAK